MPTLRRPLNAAAVHAADDDFYAAHPEMVRPGGQRVPISATNPTQVALRAEWRSLYLSHGGELEDEAPRPIEEPTLPCNRRVEPESTLQVRWSKAEVTPDHNSSFPPASPPTDTVPEEAKVKLVGITTNVPDGTGASMSIRHCVGGASVPGGSFANLLVRGNKVIDPETDSEPEWAFTAAHDLWNPWDQPFFCFSCSVDHAGLVSATPDDCVAQPAQCLRLKYWHYCIAESSSLSGVLPECNTVNGILNGVAHSSSSVQNLTNASIPLADYGSLLRNTYVCHQASHGNALKRSDNSSIPADDPGDDYVRAEYRSIVHVTPLPRFGDVQVGTAASIPSTPRYLFYASTCLTGWESSFADAMVARGTQNVIAFRRTIPDSEAPAMARKFYNCWAGTHALDPAKIPDCFFRVAGDHHANMKPILYGQGAGETSGSGGLSPLAIAAIVIGVVAVGALIGLGIYSVLKK